MLHHGVVQKDGRERQRLHRDPLSGAENTCDPCRRGRRRIAAGAWAGRDAAHWVGSRELCRGRDHDCLWARVRDYPLASLGEQAQRDALQQFQVQQPQALRPQAASRGVEIASQGERKECPLGARALAGQAANQAALAPPEAAPRSTVEPSREIDQMLDVRAGPMAASAQWEARTMSFGERRRKREQLLKEASAQRAPGW